MCDALHMVASARPTLQRKKWKLDKPSITNIIEQEGIAGIVVGIDFVSNVIDLQLLARRRRCIFLAPVVLANIAGMIFRVGICR